MARGPRPAHVGTSGWIYDDWKGAFYPKGVSGNDRLTYYARHFDTVEINLTFYRLATPRMVESWNENGDGLRFVAKGSRFITHNKKLGDVDEALRRFFASLEKLERLELVLWQLPPILKKNPERLDAFLKKLPSGFKYAVEFRNPTWYDDDIVELVDRHRCAFVAFDHWSLPDVLHVTRAPFLYLRFHGHGEDPAAYDYPDAELRRWAKRVEPYRGTKEVWAFFNNDKRCSAPKNARTFRDLLESRPALRT